MAAGKEIRGKIKSVENTKKITKAMEMVAPGVKRSPKMIMAIIGTLAVILVFVFGVPALKQKFPTAPVLEATATNAPATATAKVNMLPPTATAYGTPATLGTANTLSASVLSYFTEQLPTFAGMIFQNQIQFGRAPVKGSIFPHL